MKGDSASFYHSLLAENIIKNTAVNFNRLKRDFHFLKGITFCCSFPHCLLTDFTTTACEAEYFKGYVYM